MPKLREITIKINEALQAGNFASRKFQTGNFSDIAYLIGRIENDKEIKRPVVFDLSGEGTDVDPNDTYPIQFYHRITSPLSYPDLSTDIDGFGNPGHNNKEIADMVLVCIGSTKHIKAFREEVCAAICVDVPREFSKAILTALNLQTVNIEIIDTNTISEEVFNQEFSNVDFNLSPETFMISVKYRITTLFSKNCFELCN